MVVRLVRALALAVITNSSSALGLLSIPPLITCRFTRLTRDASVDDHSATATTTATTNVSNTQCPPNLDDNIWDGLAARAAECLYQSDIRRDAVGKTSGLKASTATNWIHDASAFALQKTMDRLRLKTSFEHKDRDEAAAWLRWMKNVPSPCIVNLSSEFQAAVSKTLTDKALDTIDQRRDHFLGRIGCRLLLFPSGLPLSGALGEPVATLIIGKLLSGGVGRLRLLTKTRRRTGERVETKPTAGDNVPVWMMYGGPDRFYEAVDMGSACVLELILLPRGKVVDETETGGNMEIGGFPWGPRDMFGFFEENQPATDLEDTLIGTSPSTLSGRDRNDAFRSDFQTNVGGLQPQIDTIVRRVLDGRVLRPANTGDKDDTSLVSSALEAKELEALGLSPVRGLLLYGPPGCGKTALAREISKALRARKPKIVSAPELLDRWVGGSEKLVRALFADAEAELASCNGDATRSALHVVVIDEIDAVFRKRSSAEDSGEATRSSVVNQILVKLDGVNSIPNLLLVGMTNRRELLDEALLRPGRLEVQIEIPLPDKEGRREILNIHFGELRKRGRLSAPLCMALDGIKTSRTEKDKGPNARTETRLSRISQRLISTTIRPAYDLADATRGFSGADIAGLIRCSGSLALSRCRKDGSGVHALLITLEDVKQALSEMRR